MPSEEPETVTVTYRIEGPPHQMATLDFLLRHMHVACEMGSTVFYSLMVDGDGSAAIRVEARGLPAELTPDEEAWLERDSERPRQLRGVQASDDGFELSID